MLQCSKKLRLRSFWPSLSETAILLQMRTADTFRHAYFAGEQPQKRAAKAALW
jgi:hypothetical protein